MNELKWNFEVNIVSVLNLSAMIGVLCTLLSAWYGLSNEVKNVKEASSSIRLEMDKRTASRDITIDALKAKDEILLDARRSVQDKTNERLYGIESKVNILSNTASRVEDAIKDLKRGSVE